MHTRYFQVGGVFEDIPVGFIAKLKRFTDKMPSRVDQFAALLENNEIVLQPARRRCGRRAGAGRAVCHGAAAARHGQPVGPAQGRSLLEL